MALPSSDDPRRHRHQSPPGAVLSSVVQPLTPLVRSGRFVAQSLLKSRNDTPDELPIARPTIALTGQALRDEIVLMGLKARRPVSQPRAFARIDREVVAALEFYGDKGWLEKPKGFFVQPPPLSDVTVRQVKGRKPTNRIQFADIAPSRSRVPDVLEWSASRGDLPGIGGLRWPSAQCDDLLVR